MNELSSNNYSLCESSDKLDPNVLNVVFDMRYILAFNFNKTFLTVFEIFANNPLSPLKKKTTTRDNNSYKESMNDFGPNV